MTDEELIARLRGACYLAFDDWCLSTAPEAADRIEALTKERDSLLAGHRVLNIGGARLQDRAETAEVKLAKAAEALERISEGENWQANEARATLAEIKGENHDPL